jgi:hypothetical protein
MLPPLTPSTKGKEKEKDDSNVGGRLMDLADDESEDGTSTPTENDAGAVTTAHTEADTSTTLPAPTEKVASMTPPVPIKKEASTTPPAPTGKEAGTTLDQPTDPKQKGTPKSDRPATPGSESSRSNDDDTEDEE